MSSRRKSSLAALWQRNNVFLINIVCPDNTTVSKVHNVKESIRDVINDCCKRLLIKTPEIFGLAMYEHNEYSFISPKKLLSKILPSSTIVTAQQAAKLNDEKVMILDTTIKTCRFYLRIKHFYINVDVLTGPLLNYYYEQVRFDTLKYQNWLNLCGYSDVFYSIASRSLWLTYGPDIVDELEGKDVNIQYHLPQCERRVDSIQILKAKLERLNDDMAADGDNEYEVNIKNDGGTAQHTRVNTDDEKNKEQYNNCCQYIMLSVIKEALKLPFYGMHYYHVTFLRENGASSSNCKLGIGPFGVTVTLSTDYTTWEECKSWSWSSVGDIKLERNMLYIHEVATGSDVAIIHRFQCIDEREAKYLLSELQETLSFQRDILERYKMHRVRKKKRNISISIISADSTSLFLSPVMCRSASLTILKSPRHQSVKGIYANKKHSSTTPNLVAYRKSSV